MFSHCKSEVEFSKIKERNVQPQTEHFALFSLAFPESESEFNAYAPR